MCFIYDAGTPLRPRQVSMYYNNNNNNSNNNNSNDRKNNNNNPRLSEKKKKFSLSLMLIMWLQAVFIVNVNAHAAHGHAHTQFGMSNYRYGSLPDGMTWDHAVDLNEDFRILWTIINQDITFEIQARTLGYVGLGFSPDGNLSGTDIAIGWVDKGQTYFQDRHVQRNGDIEPIVDSSQDYILMLGYENHTHTTLRFRRKLDTCDATYDFPITNDTMRIVYMYHEADPLKGSVQPGTLPDPSSAFRAARSLILTQKMQHHFGAGERVRMLELRNEDVELPHGENTLYWCKMFKLEDINHKHHLIKYEPIYDSSFSIHYLQHVTLYECQSSHRVLEEMARQQGHECLGRRDMPALCNGIVASWSRGSEGFTFPNEVGYPIESHEAKYYMMETHYSNLHPEHSQLHSRQMADNSGLRIYFTHKLRPNDAGFLSVGIDPGWRHIIPPGQRHVLAEGHCVEACTGYAFPPQGINIFAVLMRTHRIAREVTLRQIRKDEELPPIAHDGNIDSTYQDFRRLPVPVRSLPGDRLIAQCIYDSSSREAITLGGLSMKEETCIVLALYYPRQKKLTTCHSLTSLPTVLRSLGIDQLAKEDAPVIIALPPELAGLTLEERLTSYDWKHHFDAFQLSNVRGFFKPTCWNNRNHPIPGSEFHQGYHVNITKMYELPKRCKPKRLYATERTPDDLNEVAVLHELDNNNVIEGAARSSRSSAATTTAISTHTTHSLNQAQSFLYECKTLATTLWYTSSYIILQQLSSWCYVRNF